MTEVNDRNRFSSESWLSIQERFQSTSPRQKSMIVIYDSGRMKSIIVVNYSNWFSSESGLSTQERFQSTSPRQKCETRQAPAISAAICCIGPAGFISGIIAGRCCKNHFLLWNTTVFNIQACLRILFSEYQYRCTKTDIEKVAALQDFYQAIPKRCQNQYGLLPDDTSLEWSKR